MYVLFCRFCQIRIVFMYVLFCRFCQIMTVYMKLTETM